MIGELLLVGANTWLLARTLRQRGYEAVCMTPERFGALIYDEETIRGKNSFYIDGVLFHFDDRELAETTASEYGLQPPVLVYYSEWPVDGRIQLERRRTDKISDYWLTREDPLETDIVEHFIEVSGDYIMNCHADTADWDFDNVTDCLPDTIDSLDFNNLADTTDSWDFCNDMGRGERL